MTSPASKILLIEQEPVLLEITAFRLELLGYEVIQHASAAAATVWLEEHLPSLIAIGHLDDLDSIEFLNRLSNEERTSTIPVIYLSASADLEDVQRAFNAGADEYLVTPYNPLVLEQKVGDLLHAASEAPKH